MFFMIFQLILPVLLTPNNYFHNQVIPLPDRLGVVDQTFTKLDLVYSDFIQENFITTNMVSVLIMDSQKYGHNQIYLHQISYAKTDHGGAHCTQYVRCAHLVKVVIMPISPEVLCRPAAGWS